MHTPTPNNKRNHFILFRISAANVNATSCANGFLRCARTNYQFTSARHRTLSQTHINYVCLMCEHAQARVRALCIWCRVKLKHPCTSSATELKSPRSANATFIYIHMLIRVHGWMHVNGAARVFLPASRMELCCVLTRVFAVVVVVMCRACLFN